MALQFHPLPAEIFDEKARPYIKRLNFELRDLFGLEGTIRQPITTRSSDLTIARRSELQVAVSRITPSIASVVSGVSTVVGTPALTLGTANTIGSTATALSVNSAIAIFGTQAPIGLSLSAAVGTSTYAARADHVHAGFDATVPAALGSTAATGTVDFGARRDHVHLYPPILRSTANASLLTLTDDATNQTWTAAGVAGRIIVVSPDDSMALPSRIALGSTIEPTPDSACLFTTRTSIAGVFMRAGLEGGITADDASAHTSELFFGGILRATCANTAGATYTSVTVRGLDIQLTATVHTTNTHSYTERTGLRISAAVALQSGSGAVSCTDVHGIRVLDFPAIGTVGTYTNVRAVRIQMPTIGATIRRGFSLETGTQNVGTEAANVEGYYCEDLTRGTARRASFYGEGATTGTPTDVYGFFQGTAHVVGTNRYGARYTGATTGTPTLSVGVQADAHAVGTTKRSFIGADPAQFGGIVMDDATDIVVNATTGTKIGTATTQKIGWWNAAPVVQSTGWTTSNVTSDKVLNADSYTTDELADVVCTIIDTLKTYGLFGA